MPTMQDAMIDPAKAAAFTQAPAPDGVVAMLTQMMQQQQAMIAALQQQVNGMAQGQNSAPAPAPVPVEPPDFSGLKNEEGALVIGEGATLLSQRCTADGSWLQLYAYKGREVDADAREYTIGLDDRKATGKHLEIKVYAPRRSARGDWQLGRSLYWARVGDARRFRALWLLADTLPDPTE